MLWDNILFKFGRADAMRKISRDLSIFVEIRGYGYEVYQLGLGVTLARCINSNFGSIWSLSNNIGVVIYYLYLLPSYSV